MGLVQHVIKHYNFVYIFQMTIACSWIFGIVITFPMFLSRNFDKENDCCVYTWSEEGWVKPIAWFGFCLQDFSRLLSWSLYTPKSCTLCGSHVQSQEDVSIVCNRFETKFKTTRLIPIYSCKKKFSLAMQKFLCWSFLFVQDSWIFPTGAGTLELPNAPSSIHTVPVFHWTPSRSAT